MWELNPNLKIDTSGIDLCERYYKAIGRPMLQARFADYIPRMAMGVAGDGSDCFGFDDAISTDHDWGPGFCVWLTDEDYAAIAQELNAAYQALPEDFGGKTYNYHKAQAAGRRGAINIGNFFRGYLGRPEGPQTNMEWLQTPESYLAVATNGKVFEDNLGKFTAIRERLLGYYPEDVRRKKIAAKTILMAHTGQANFCRCMARFDTVAASMALHQFIEATMLNVYLLNKRYAPYYKWMWRGLEGISRLSDVPEMVRQLAETKLDPKNWTHTDGRISMQPPNMNDPAIVLIERICSRVAEELRAQGFSNERGDYLEGHAYSVQSGIKDPQLRQTNIMRG